MAERVINRPLSGAEIRTAILADIEKSMKLDSRLQDHLSYPQYKMKVRIDLELIDPGGSGTHKTAHEAAIASLETDEIAPADPDSFPLNVELLREPQPPNQVRVETGQGVPVLSKDVKGRTIERNVTYKDKAHRA